MSRRASGEDSEDEPRRCRPAWLAAALATVLLASGCRVVGPEATARRGDASGAEAPATALAPLLRRVAASCRSLATGMLSPGGCRPPSLAVELAALESRTAPARVVGEYADLWSAAGPALPLVALARLETLAQSRDWALRAATPAAVALLVDWLRAHPRATAFGARVARLLGLLAGARGSDQQVIERLAAPSDEVPRGAAGTTAAPEVRARPSAVGRLSWAIAAFHGALWTHGRAAVLPRLQAALAPGEDLALRVAVLNGFSGGWPWTEEERARVCPLLRALLAADEPLEVASSAGFRAADACVEASRLLLATARRWLDRRAIDELMIMALARAGHRLQRAGPAVLASEVAPLLACVMREQAIHEAVRASALSALYGLDAPQARRLARGIVGSAKGQSSPVEGPLRRAARRVLAIVPAKGPPPGSRWGPAATAPARRSPVE